MTTPPQDPYENRPQPADGEPAPSPSAPPPGMLVSGAPEALPAPMQVDAPPLGMATDWTPERPTGLSTAAIVLTAAYAGMGVFAGLTTQATVDQLKNSSGSASTSPAGAATSVLTLVVGVASLVVLALWMSRIRKNLLARGVKAGGPPAVEWWGWFVPFANFVLPLLGMRAIAQRKVSAGTLLGWWLPFCLVWILQGASSVISISAVDFSTGDLREDAAFGALVPIGYTSAVAIVISWVFLMMIIRRVTASHLED